MAIKYTTSTFIEKAREKHGDKYDYSKVEYTDSLTKVCIICPKHGEFWQRPDKHLRGQGCKKYLYGSYDGDSFVRRANCVHNNFYDYSKVYYKHTDEPVTIICPIHGDFQQTPHSHLQGRGCTKCANRYIPTTEEVIKESSVKHNGFYRYDKFVYQGVHKKSIITCPIHGDFQQSPHHHLQGKGCPKCKSSKLEKSVRLLLETNNISFVEQANNQVLPWIELLSLDFYLPDYNIAIECQGIQHFSNIGLYGKSYQDNIKRDKRKMTLCKANNVTLLYYSDLHITYPYPVITNLDDILKEIKNV